MYNQLKLLSQQDRIELFKKTFRTLNTTMLRILVGHCSCGMLGKPAGRKSHVCEALSTFVKFHFLSYYGTVGVLITAEKLCLGSARACTPNFCP